MYDPRKPGIKALPLLPLPPKIIIKNSKQGSKRSTSQQYKRYPAPRGNLRCVGHCFHSMRVVPCYSWFLREGNLVPRVISAFKMAGPENEVVREGRVSVV